MKYLDDKELANSYDIQEFDPKDLLMRDGVMSIVAGTGSGKTVFIKDCLSHVRKAFKHIILFSKTAKLQRCYDFIDPSMIHEQFDEEYLTKLYNDHVQKQLNGDKQERTLLIFDDILNEKAVRRSSIFDDYFTGSRHLGISLWLLSHNYTSLKPLQRVNTCWFVSFDLDSYRERKNFCCEYLSADNVPVGMRIFDNIVKEKKHQCIVIECHKKGCGITDKIKKYVANPEPEPFKIKKTEAIKIHQYTELEKEINTLPRKTR
jgi:hypothetical protein